MTKSELIEAVADKLKLPKGKAELIVNCVFDAMETALKTGERIEIRGFGSFEIRHYKAYEGRNPRTGAKVDVRPKRLPFFKVGKELKERVNEGAQAAADAQATLDRAAATEAPPAQSDSPSPVARVSAFEPSSGRGAPGSVGDGLTSAPRPSEHLPPKMGSTGESGATGGSGSEDVDQPPGDPRPTYD